MELKGKTALVTGASKGIGRAVALALAKEGCSVVVNYKSDKDAAEATVLECNKLSTGNTALQADVSSEDEVKAMLAKIPRLDVLVNNAGIFDDNDSPTNLKAFANIYRNNFLSTVLVTKYALSVMKIGKIINLSSIHGRLGHGGSRTAAYSAFKAGLESYTKNLAKVVAPHILINAVAPGYVLTPMWGDPDAKEQERLGSSLLIKRMITPDEVADAVMFLVKNDAMCGEILTIDGGMSLVTLG